MLSRVATIGQAQRAIRLPTSNPANMNWEGSFKEAECETSNITALHPNQAICTVTSSTARASQRKGSGQSQFATIQISRCCPSDLAGDDDAFDGAKNGTGRHLLTLSPSDHQVGIQPILPSSPSPRPAASIKFLLGYHGIL